MCYLCFDLGTTKIKSALLDINGNFIYLSNTNTNIYKDKGSYQLPNDFYNIVLKEIEIIKSKKPKIFKNINSIIFSGQMAGALGVDEDFNVIFPWVFTINSRINKYLNLIEKKFGPTIREKSGCVPYMAAIIKLIESEEKESFRRIKKFINLNTFVGAKLCNLHSKDSFIDYSLFNYSGLADVKNNKWNEDLCKELKINIEQLPKVVKPYEIIGFINKNVFNTKRDIKVLAGIGDQIAGFIGCGAINKNDLVDVAGTYTVLGHCTNDFKNDPNNLVFSAIYTGISDIYYQMAVIGPGGYTYDWFINRFNYKPNLKFEKYEGSNGLFFIPYIGGRYHPPQPYYDGSWIGIKYSHILDNFYASILESLSFEFNYYIKILKKLNNFKSKDFNVIKLIGGGQKDNFWTNIKANVLNINYLKMNKIPFEILGIYLISKYGKNIKEGIEELINNKTIHTEDIIKPNCFKVKYYDQLKLQYLKIIKDLERVYFKFKRED